MAKPTLFSAVLFLCVSISFVFGSKPAEAQGPAGAGAASAAQDSARFLNPMNWMKKDSGRPEDGPALRADVEKKLTPRLQSNGILPANATLTDSCSPFLALEDCLTALHASRNLGLDFNCVRAAATGVHTSADVSGCKVADGEKAQGLNKAIHQLKPDANAGRATKDAEQQAIEDLKGVGA